MFFYPVKFGATLVERGLTRFRFWAPAQENVAVDIEGAASVAMRRQEHGWFEAEVPCRAGTRYRYRLANGALVPDPASRAQAEDVHGASLVVDPDAYQWRHPEWRGRPWHETVCYELHAGALGGFNGVQRILPRLAELGITAVELMPIADFPGRRNWGYDGVLPYAPARAYGTPDELKALIDTGHGLGLMMFLDVVYNHFGPDGNYLGQYAPETFRSDIATPWGAAIDFRRTEVRRFFIENALYWIMEYRFDGLRFDAVHAITDETFVDDMGAEIRAAIEPGRHVHLVLEHDANIAAHLRGPFDAQWNDDAHHVLHAILTGEREGYYADFSEQPAHLLARCLSEGFIYQGQPSPYRSGEPRGTPSADLPPTAFVLFLQNHDQIGNRAFGERLTTLARAATLEAAIALQLLCPQIPLLFMGEEDASSQPFLYFSDHRGDLADAVREGRRREFAGFGAFADPGQLARIPDPNANVTFEQSIPRPDPNVGDTRREFYRRLLYLRHQEIVPRLVGARAIDAQVIGDAAVVVRWRMGDGAMLTIAANLGDSSAEVACPNEPVLFESAQDAARAVQSNRLLASSTVAFLGRPE
jgi:malto-oligosyltrehalose trehalohydrolase